MLKAFNALQITTFFAASPFIVGWLWSTADFPGVGPLKWVAGIVYTIFFVMMVLCTLAGLEKLD